MISSRAFEAFLYLIRRGIGHSTGVMPDSFDWASIRVLSKRHGLMAIVMDGIEQLPEDKRLPRAILLSWIGEVILSYERRFVEYCSTVAEIASFYNAHGYRMMVLKGYACSLDWPRPNHRPCGDIDIWQFGDYEKADELVTSEKGILIDASHHHHTVFKWGNFMVENHYDFINVHHHKSNAEFERILKKLGQDDSHFVEVGKGKVYMPSPDLHALFLLKHLMMHFASEGITLRQLLDWGFFVEKHGRYVSWSWVEGVLDKFGMKVLYGIFNAICVEDLGFHAYLFHYVQFEPALKERVLHEIVIPEFGEELPKRLMQRIVFKLKRWRGNSWKHELCYSENLWSAFWSGVWNHILKPSSI